MKQFQNTFLSLLERACLWKPLQKWGLDDNFSYLVADMRKGWFRRHNLNETISDCDNSTSMLHIIWMRFFFEFSFFCSCYCVSSVSIEDWINAWGLVQAIWGDCAVVASFWMVLQLRKRDFCCFFHCENSFKNGHFFGFFENIKKISKPSKIIQICWRMLSVKRLVYFDELNMIWILVEP